MVNENWKPVLQAITKVFAILAVVLMLTAGAQRVMGQACTAQNWSASTPNIWAADGSIKVMLNNSSTTNQPTIPTYEYDGNFNPWGYTQHPQTIAELNDVWSCPSGTPEIAVAGAGRETVSFQVFISASASAALSDLSVVITPLTGPGTAISSDNTGSSSITRYLEGYVPYSGINVDAPPQLQANGQMPDPLIPFYDPYDSGNPAVATPFNVQSGTTQGVWVNVSIPAGQTAGTYNGTVTVSGNGVGSVSIPLQLTVWNGTLPTFDAGSINTAYADMLKSWLPFYEGSFINGEGLTCGGPGCSTGQALMAKYQIMGHAYDIDVQDEGWAGSGLSPTNSGCYPSWGSCTSFTTDGHTSSINWTAYDAYVGPSLTPGGLFSDGTAERVLDSPLSTEGAGAWVGGGWNWTDQNGNAPVPPAGLMQLVTNYATQISQHFSANHTSKGWVVPDLISYTFDETYNDGHAKDLGGNPLIYQIISSYNEAINSSNSALSSTWAASTAPIHNFLTDEPACQEDGDNPNYTNSVCADHINLSYPGGANSTPGYTNSWVIDWSSNPSIFMPGQPGPALNYGVDPTIIAGTGYQYTYDLSQGVTALSTAPVPVERWFYQGGDPFNTADGISATGVGQRANYWIAYKYGLDETVASTGDPSPAAPAPGTVWIWVGDFWGGYGGSATPSNCNGSGPSPFVSASTGGDGVLFYPGNEVGCYYTANPVGTAALTKSPVVNSSCTSNGYNVCNGISGPVASMRMEAMRRGYEDYEYLYLLGKQSGRSASLAIINTLGVAGMTAGGLGTTSWQALDWENTDGPWYAMGVEPQSSAYSGYCTDSTPGIGGLANGLPNGSTGAASTGSNFGYGPCPGEWTNNPYRYEAARVQLAQALGFAAAGTTVATPTFSPAGGTYTSPQTVTISDSTSGATIYYTTNGTTPTTSSPVYSSPISVTTTETIEALGVKSGDTNSSIGSATYTINSSTVATPTFSPVAGTYNNSQSVTISDATSGATIHYTTNGSTPTASSPVYSSPISVTSTETIKALGVKSGYTNSAVGSATYTLKVATPTFSPAAGTYGSAQTVTISDSTSGTTIHYTTNGSTPTASSATYSSPIVVSVSETVKALGIKTGYTNSAVGSAAYVISASPVITTLAGVQGGTTNPANGTVAHGNSVGAPYGVAVAPVLNGAGGDVYFDNSNNYDLYVIYKGGAAAKAILVADGISSPVIGDVYSIPSPDETGPWQSRGLAIDSYGNVLLADPAYNRVYMYYAGEVTGQGTNPADALLTADPSAWVVGYGLHAGYAYHVVDGGSVVGSAPTTPQPKDVWVDSKENVFFTDGAGNGLVEVVYNTTGTSANTILTAEGYTSLKQGYTYIIAGGLSTTTYPYDHDSGSSVAYNGSTSTSNTAINNPLGIYGDSAGDLIFADNTSNKIKKLSGTTAVLSTIGGPAAGTATTVGHGGDGGPATSAQMNGPIGVILDASGNVYFADSANSSVRMINTSGTISTVAGTSGTSGTYTGEGGPATSAVMNTTYYLSIDGSGNIYIADNGNDLIHVF